MLPDPHEENRRSWNAATKAHNSHKRDQAQVLAAGGHTLFSEEITLLGDVRGKSVVHLQCNAGQDTLSIASLLGAQVTGIDISDEAIAFARGLSAESGIPAEFVRSDLFDWFDHTQATFDVVYTGYGALNWLSDINRWARGVAKILRGRLVVIEFHPVMGMFTDEGFQLEGDALGGTHTIWDEGGGDYVAATGDVDAHFPYEPGMTDFTNPHRAHEWMWGIGDVIGAVLAAGLTLRHFTEYPYSNGFRRFPQMRALPGRRFAMPEDLPAIPMMYSLVAER
ncbi:MAG: class I SAM-dependent methyltransferase [Anaerolineae bacterium]